MYRADRVTRTYGSTRALTDVTFTVEPGEVHALLGMNGAGKSTLVKILAGVEQPDSGRLSLAGSKITLASPREAFAHGIAVVAQDLNVFDQLDVTANLFLLHEPRRAGLLAMRAMRRRAAESLATVGLHLDPQTKVGDLSQSDKQRLAIARATLFRPRVLVLDEPTSALQPSEKDRLLDVVRQLRADGTAIVYVSHFLEEVFRIADRVTVLRDGSVVTPGAAVADTTLQQTVRDMTGPQAEQQHQPVSRTAARPLPSGSGLDIEGLSRRGHFHQVDLRVRSGEILGLAGLEGCGARSLLSAVFGTSPADSGTATLSDGTAVGTSVPASVRAGVAYLPADRQASGVMPDATILDNLLQVRAGALGREGWFLRRRVLARRAADRIAQLGIKSGSLDAPLSSLSGGNQQKVMIGKWLEADARVYLLDDPTAAVDVHARLEIHAIMRHLATSGHCVLMTSSDPTELLELCDRIAVMHSGRLTAVRDTSDLSSHELLEAINTGTPADTAGAVANAAPG